MSWSTPEPNWESVNYETVKHSELRKYLFGSYQRIGGKHAPDSVADPIANDYLAIAKHLSGTKTMSPADFSQTMTRRGLTETSLLVELFKSSEIALEGFIASCTDDGLLKQTLFYNGAMRWQVREIWERARAKVASAQTNKTSLELSRVEQAVWNLFERGVITETVLRYKNEWHIDLDELNRALSDAYLRAADRGKFMQGVTTYRQWVKSYQWYHLHSMMWAWIKYLFAKGECYDVSFMNNLGREIRDMEIRATQLELAKLKQEHEEFKALSKDQAAALKAAQQEVSAQKVALAEASQKATQLEAQVGTLKLAESEVAEKQALAEKVESLSKAVKQLQSKARDGLRSRSSSEGSEGSDGALDIETAGLADISARLGSVSVGLEQLGSSFEASNREQSDKISALSESLEELRQELSSFKRSHQDAALRTPQAMKGVKTRLSQQERRAALHAEELESIGLKLHQFEDDFGGLSEQVSGLQEAVSGYQEALAGKVDAAVIDEFRAAIARIEGDVARVSGERVSAEQDIVALQRDMAGLQASLKELVAQVVLTERHDELSSQVSELKEQLTALDSQYAEQVSKNLESIEALLADQSNSDSIQTLFEQLGAIQTTLEPLQQQVTGGDGLQSKVTSALKTLAGLSEAFSNVASLPDEVQQIHRFIGTLQENVHDLEARQQKAVTREELEQLSQRLTGLNESQSQIQAQSQRDHERSTELLQLTHELGQLQVQMRDFNELTFADDLAELREQKVDRAQLEELKRTVAKLAEELRSHATQASLSELQVRFEALQEKAKEFARQEDVAQLSQEVEQLSERTLAVTSKLNLTSEAVTKLDQSLDALKQADQTKTGELKQLQHALSGVREAIDAAKSLGGAATEAAKQQFEQLSARIAQVAESSQESHRDLVESLRADHQALSEQLEALKQAQDTLATAESVKVISEQMHAVQQGLAEIDAQKQKMVELTGTVVTLDQKISAISGQLQETSSSLDSLTQELESLKQTDGEQAESISDIQVALSAVRERVAGTQDSGREAAEQAQRQYAELSDRITLLAASNQESNQALAGSITQNHQALLAQLQSLTAAQELLASTDNLTSLSAELDDVKLKVTTLETQQPDEIQGLATKVTGLHRELVSLLHAQETLVDKALVLELQQQVSELGEHVEEVQAAQAKAVKQSHVDDLQRRIESLEGELPSLRQLPAEARELRQQLGDLHQRLSELSRQQTETTSQMVSQETIEEMQEEYAALKQELQSLVRQDVYQEHVRAYDAFRAEAASWAKASTVAQLQQQLDSLVETVDAAQIDAVKQQLESLQAVTDELTAKQELSTESIREEISVFQESLDALTSSVDNLDENPVIKGLQSRLNAFSERLDADEQAAHAFVTMEFVEGLQGEISALQESITGVGGASARLTLIEKQLEETSQTLVQLSLAQESTAKSEELARVFDQLQALKAEVQSCAKQDAQDALQQRIDTLEAQKADWAKAADLNALSERFAALSETSASMTQQQASFKEQFETLSETIKSLQEEQANSVNQDSLTELSDAVDALKELVEAKTAAYAQSLSALSDSVSQQIKAVETTATEQHQEQIDALRTAQTALQAQIKELELSQQTFAQAEALSALELRVGALGEADEQQHAAMEAARESQRVMAETIAGQKEAISAQITALSEACEHLQQEQAQFADKPALEQLAQQLGALGKALKASEKSHQASLRQQSDELVAKIDAVSQFAEDAHQEAAASLEKAKAGLLEQLQSLAQAQQQCAQADVVKRLQAELKQFNEQLQHAESSNAQQQAALREQLSSLESTLAALASQAETFVVKATAEQLQEQLTAVKVELDEVAQAQQQYATVEMLQGYRSMVTDLDKRLSELEQSFGTQMNDAIEQLDVLNRTTEELTQKLEEKAQQTDVAEARGLIESIRDQLQSVAAQQGRITEHDESLQQLAASLGQLTDKLDGFKHQAGEEHSALKGQLDQAVVALSGSLEGLQEAQTQFATVDQVDALQLAFAQMNQEAMQEATAAHDALGLYQADIAGQMAALSEKISQANQVESEAIKQELESLREQLGALTGSEEYERVLAIYQEFGEQLNDFTSRLAVVEDAYAQDSDLRASMQQLHERLKSYDPNEQTRLIKAAEAHVNGVLKKLIGRFDTDEKAFHEMRENIYLTLSTMDKFFRVSVPAYNVHWSKFYADMMAQAKSPKPASPETPRRAEPGTPPPVRRAQPGTPPSRAQGGTPEASTSTPLFSGHRAQPGTPPRRAREGTPEASSSRAKPGTPVKPKAQPTTPTQSKAQPTTPQRAPLSPLGRVSEATPPRPKPNLRAQAGTPPSKPQARRAAAPGTPPRFNANRRDSFGDGKGGMKFGVRYQAQPGTPDGKENRATPSTPTTPTRI